MIRFVILTGLFVVSGMAVSCGGPEEAADRLYGSDEFTVYAGAYIVKGLASETAARNNGINLNGFDIFPVK